MFLLIYAIEDLNKRITVNTPSFRKLLNRGFLSGHPLRSAMNHLPSWSAWTDAALGRSRAPCQKLCWLVRARSFASHREEEHRCLQSFGQDLLAGPHDTSTASTQPTTQVANADAGRTCIRAGAAETIEWAAVRTSSS